VAVAVLIVVVIMIVGAVAFGHVVVSEQLTLPTRCLRPWPFQDEVDDFSP